MISMKSSCLLMRSGTIDDIELVLAMKNPPPTLSILPVDVRALRCEPLCYFEMPVLTGEMQRLIAILRVWREMNTMNFEIVHCYGSTE